MPIQPLFITDFSNIPRNDINKYHFTYHKKYGFGIERKQSFNCIVSRVYDAIIRFFKSLVGYNYQFEQNVTHFCNALYTDLSSLDNVSGSIKCALRLQILAEKRFSGHTRDQLSGLTARLIELQ